MAAQRELLKRNGGERGSMDYYVPISSREFPSERFEPRNLLKTSLCSCLVIVIVLIATAGGLAVLNTVRPIRAGCDVIIDFAHSCREVRSEIFNRVRGQSNHWHDPHNNGSYNFFGDQTTDEISLERISGSGSKIKYTDNIVFSFVSSANNQYCRISATSNSQVFSILDFGTNFCNINNLYCSDEGCRPFKFLSYVYKVGKCTSSRIKFCYTV